MPIPAHIGVHKSNYTCKWATYNRRGLAQTSCFALISHNTRSRLCVLDQASRLIPIPYPSPDLEHRVILHPLRCPREAHAPPAQHGRGGSRNLSLYRIITPIDVMIAQEIAAWRKEALAYKAIRNALCSPQTADDTAKTVFEKSMADMWRSREKLIPLDFDAILDGSFVVKEPTEIAASSSNSKGQVNGHADGDAMKPSSSNGNSGLKDQRALTLRDKLALFVSRYALISLRSLTPAFDPRRLAPTA
ncbi:hypothetical protein JVT61DRAFT_9427 [Boletus reticuloceps]|uniref:Uncharacterized protein n=1 Tax=Boletus reticuloceps TaxID=495285 RepID=A0A8I2YGI0_9AGAM|nr:hypothetical protein JVT61DRAFT_9427 [Boletus reticuloceps]